MEEKTIFTTREAAKHLGISVSTIYRMEKQGLITSIKTPGGQRRFSKENIEKYLLESKKIEAPQNPSKFKKSTFMIKEAETIYNSGPTSQIEELFFQDTHLDKDSQSTHILNNETAKHFSENKGYIFACTDKTEAECFEKMLFSTNKLYADNVLQIKKGDTLFLFNMDKDVLYGIFKAISDGKKDIIPNAWKGMYPYQVKVEKDGEIKTINNAKKILLKMNISWKNILIHEELELLTNFIANPDNFNWSKVNNKKSNIIYNEKPAIEATTLWDYPKQSYGKTQKGNNKYAGVTPAFIIYNMVKRYTEVGDLVVDPMAGSGTTLDVCKEENRRCIAYDIAPPRPDIFQNDARHIPLTDNSVDMIFIDSPYGDNIKYNDHPNNIGNISSESEIFYDELEKVMKECHRILKPGKVLGWLIGDQWVKKRFTPVGFKIYERLCKYFDTVDIICVARRGQTSNTGIWYNRAIRFNFYLRGFKYLFLMRKLTGNFKNNNESRIINWTQYSRK